MCQHAFQTKQFQFPLSYYENTSVNMIVSGPRVIIDGDLLPPFPFQIVCPCCRQMVQTRIEYRAGSATHLAAFLLCIFGCWPCCLLPYCLTSCQFPAHFCPNCQAFIGMAPNV
ncbi:Hypothetical predicted protein [Cloeon dipterum]|uniref:LITAF domain-containing protein n=1 Tax=Cloeon dipterum TaxID=197152 RepID=A0A8S1CHR3_9INSE|nr:Hypothetical predicted protein [Cloeon dipterum]